MTRPSEPQAPSSGAQPLAHLDEWVTPNTADDAGHLRMGTLLEWMHMVGVLAASRHCRAPVATVAVDGLQIMRPLRVGDRISLDAQVIHTSAHTVTVRVHVAVERKPVAQGNMAFVQPNRAGQLLDVPQFSPEADNQVQAYHEIELRRLERQRLRGCSPFETGFLTLLAPNSAAPAANDLDTTGATRRRAILRRPPLERPAGHGRERADTQLLHVARTIEVLKTFPTDITLPWDLESSDPNGHFGHVRLTEMVCKPHLNLLGKLHGGIATRWIEHAACLSARAWLGHAPARLTSMHGITFQAAPQEHQFVHIQAGVAHTDQDSLTVLVALHSEDPTSNTQESVARTLFTYAPVSRISIPKLDLYSNTEHPVFREVAQRIELQRELPTQELG